MRKNKKNIKKKAMECSVLLALFMYLAAVSSIGSPEFTAKDLPVIAVTASVSMAWIFLFAYANNGRRGRKCRKKEIWR